MNVGDTVYVRWYGDVLEGKVVNNDKDNSLLGKMIAVRIPLQGIHAIALFFPEHVYQTAEEAKTIVSVESAEKPVDHLFVQPETTTETFITEETDVALVPAEKYMDIISFKESHWDHEHNHLQVDALDEFYELWKAYSNPILAIPKDIDTDIDRLAEEFANYDGRIYVADAEPTILLESNKEPVSQNDTAPEKPKKSNPTITQLSLFD